MARSQKTGGINIRSKEFSGREVSNKLRSPSRDFGRTRCSLSLVKTKLRQHVTISQNVK